VKNRLQTLLLSRATLYRYTKEDPVGKFDVKEGLFLLAPIWIGLLYALVTYGIPDY
jgi:hypothetical protein